MKIDGNKLQPGSKQAESALRKNAEDILRKNASSSIDQQKGMLPEEIRQKLHELKVHQIELETQNEELLRTQTELDVQKERFSDFYDLAPVGYCTISEKGLILDANLTASTLLGVSIGALIRQPLSQFILSEDQDIYYLHKKQLFQTLEPQSCQLRMVKEDRTIFWARLEAIVKQDKVGTPVCRIVMSDIFEQKFREDIGDLADLLVSQINSPDDLHQRMSNLTTSLQNWSACEAIGIRLKDGDDYPYYETRGFPSFFVQAESHLCVHGTNGEILRDSTGNSVLECMCGNILRGRFDISKPFFTANGSFWTNSTTTLLSSTSEADRQARTRNRCNGEGYESVALIPLRIDNHILGLLQFNDRRPDRFCSALIAHFEKIAGIVATALWRRQTEERLQESEAHYRSIFDNSLVGVTVTDKNFIIVDANDAFCQMLGYSRDELIGKMTIPDISCPDDAVKSVNMIEKLMRRETDHYSLEKGYISKTGRTIPALIFVNANYDHNGDYEGTTASILDITERMQAEEALRESEQRHRQYITNTPYGVFVTNAKGQYIQVNPAACRMTGYKERELLAMSVPDLCLEEDLDEGLRHFQRLVDRGESQGELPFRHKSGEKRWWSVTAVKISDTRFLGFCNDITDRKCGEEALKREKIMLARTERIAHVGSWEWDIATDTVTWSDELFRIFQRDPREGAPRFAEHPTFYHPDDMMRLRQAVEAAVSRGTTYELELRAFRKDGQTRICKAYGFSEMDKTGKAVRLFGSFQDITERKKAEESYQTLFQEMLDGFALHEIICDEAGLPADYRFLAVNPAFERMTGLKASNILGRTVLEVMPGTERHWIETYGRVALTGEPKFFENFAKDLEKHFQVTAFCPEPGQFACIFVDITDRKKAEEGQQKLREHLQQAQKMEAIGTLAGGIAHDFNNILGAIIGYAEMAEEDIPAGSMVKNDIEQVLKASHRAKDLVKQVLAFSRQAEAELIPIQPVVILKEAIKMLRSSLPTTIAIQQDIDPESGFVLADPTQIHQIAMNLCTNAFHAMEETGGTLTINLKKKTLSLPDIPTTEPNIQPGDFLQMSIEDTGTGIAPEILEKIFDPYFTTKEVGKGTGMGLAIIHGIVKSYNGFITCQSRLNQGTVFQVYLPVIAKEALPETEPLDIIQLGNEHILYIDDEEILAEMGKHMFERLGYRVTVRTNSMEALAVFQNQPDAFDLVVTDQTMPGMTGIDLALRMMQIRPGMPIILCTGYSSQVSKEKAMSFGIKGFAMKPLARKDIAVLIRNVLDAEKSNS